jgi:hypothetical protein
MPQVHVRFEEEVITELDELRWALRYPSRNALVVSLVEMFAPFNTDLLARFIIRHFTDQADELIAKLTYHMERLANE